MAGPVWDLPLSQVPEIPIAGIGCHGRTPPFAKYCFPDIWCVHLYKYSALLVINREEFRITPGTVSVVPPLVNFEHHWETYPSVHTFAWFRPIVAGKQETEREPAVRIAALQHLGHEWEMFSDLFSDVIEPIYTAQPPRVAAFVWSLLWHLAPRATAGDPATAQLHPGVARATRLMKAHMNNPLRVEDLSAAAGVSPSHLGRLFRQTYGVTPMRYLRMCRVEQARHLLTTTSLPVKEIAGVVGVHDLQFFNKMIRHDLGHAPRELREWGRIRAPGE
jgi:AraC family transcriptional regulator